MMSWKKIMFWFLVLCFIVLTPPVLLYASGYRWNWEEKKLELTGSIHVKASPSDTHIFVDGKALRYTSLLGGSALIKHVTPGEHTIRLEKYGYHPWEKKLLIKERETVSIPTIRLFPVTKAVDEILRWPDEEVAHGAVGTDKIIVAEKSPTGVILHKTQEENSEEIKIPIKNITSFNVSPQESKIIVFSPKDEWEILDISATSSKSLLSQKQAKLKISETNFFWSPTDENIFFFIDNGLLKKYLINQKSVQTVAQDILSASLRQQEIIVLDKKGRISRLTLEGRVTGRDLNQILFLGQKTENGRFLFQDDSVAFITSDRDLFWLDPDDRAMKPIAPKTDNALFDGKKRKILYWNDSEIWAYWLEEERVGIKKEKGRKELIGRYFQPVKYAAWHPSGNYIFIAFPEKILLVELDGRDRRNSYTFHEGKGIRYILVSENEDKLISVERNRIVEIDLQ